MFSTGGFPERAPYKGTMERPHLKEGAALRAIINDNDQRESLSNLIKHDI